MSAYAGTVATGDRPHAPPRRIRRSLRARAEVFISGDYGHGVPPPVEIRKRAFAAFVRRALSNAEVDRGWSIPRVAREAGIGNPTIYRWRDGDWVKAPDPDAVLAFCDALDINPQHVWAILWPGKNADAPPPEPAPLDRDIELLARRLRDPNVDEAEKVNIRAHIRYLIGRAAAPAGAE